MLLKKNILDKTSNFLFIVPALVLFCMFSIYPLFMTFYLSLFRWDGLTDNMTFIWFDNFIYAFTDGPFWQSMLNSLYYAVLAMLIMNPAALLLSVLVHSGVRLTRYYRVVYYIPPMISALVVGYLWKWMYEPYDGIINTILGTNLAWLSSKYSVIPAVSIASIWQGVGGSFILFWAGLENINQEMYEAAEIDGATNMQQLRIITMPLLSKVYSVVTILTVLGTVNMFPLVNAMTQGGPGFASIVPVYQIYNTAFESSRYGYASTISLIVGLTMLAFSYLRLKLSKED